MQPIDKHSDIIPSVTIVDAMVGDSAGGSTGNCTAENTDFQNIDFRQYLTAAEIKAIEHDVMIMGSREAAGIEALKVVQQHRGWISDHSLCAIAQCLDISSAQLEGVATFYNLIYRQPVGHYVIHLCDSISCHLCGYDDILQTIKQHLAIDYGQTTADGEFTLLSNACLGNCDKSPAMMINDHHYHSLTPSSVVAILNGLSQHVEPADDR